MKITVLIFLVFITISCTQNDSGEETGKAAVNIDRMLVTEIQPQGDLSKIMYVSAPLGLRVRNSPGLDGEVIGTLDSGTEVIITYSDNNIMNIDGIEGRWVYIKLPIRGWVFGGFLIDDAIASNNINSFENNNTVVERGLDVMNQRHMRNISLKHNLREYFHLSDEYFSIGGETLLFINVFDRSLSVSTDGRNMPNFETFWGGREIIAVSQIGNDYILTVLEVVGGNMWEPLTVEKQIMLTQLQDRIYEVNVLSPDASEFLNFLDRKQFRRAETFANFAPDHIVRYVDVD